MYGTRALGPGGGGAHLGFHPRKPLAPTPTPRRGPWMDPGNGRFDGPWLPAQRVVALARARPSSSTPNNLGKFRGRRAGTTTQCTPRSAHHTLCTRPSTAPVFPTAPFAGRWRTLFPFFPPPLLVPFFPAFLFPLCTLCVCVRGARPFAATVLYILWHPATNPFSAVSIAAPCVARLPTRVSCTQPPATSSISRRLAPDPRASRCPPYRYAICNREPPRDRRAQPAHGPD
ncbi:hypothetical protein T440DRAFT_529991 [Plenodomus tracheiphilus IPT5]|uniref:Uncharacterized protein n=1 Tax=Plenodomus tracheiphilus IPT5 TaxID=1408161 RepID=A0A6A7B8D8_9PLEO|nr:hypothetical protein T440DRAFT_529991 [Plenodomus tracheiphilus IPT5]